MQRRTLLQAAFPALVFTATGTRAQPRFQPTPQQRADLGRIEQYLDGIHTLKAQFLQVAPDGAISRGTVWLDRPGRMRFQYDPPAPFLLVAGHGLLVFHDRDLGQTSNIPLSRTPLGILLADQVSLSGDVTVTGMQELPGQIQVTLVRTRSPGEGSLTLVFTDTPLTLRQWVIVDAQRQPTRVTLSDIQYGVKLDPSLFNFVDPRALQGGSSG
jgi:outer membrane lipoprotein-sorting protein